MTLMLTVVGSPDATPLTRTVEGAEFSIGRGTGNDLVLDDPDRHLSKRHCVLVQRRGVWQVADLSANGTYYNGEEDPVGQGLSRELRDGDRLRVGNYHIEIRFAPRRRSPPAEREPAPAAPAAADGTLLGAFLAGAGVPGVVPADPRATMRSLGRALRAAVSGLRAVLGARAAIKTEFRIDSTMIRARGNNPLKFSVDDDEALVALLGGGRTGDMDAAAAITEALRDMRLHELASMAAMQAAVRALLEQFAPARIRTLAEEGGGMTMLPAQRRGRAWQVFEQLHSEITQALADDFDSVFGKTFARAYEKAISEARAQNADELP